MVVYGEPVLAHVLARGAGQRAAFELEPGRRRRNRLVKALLGVVQLVVLRLAQVVVVSAAQVEAHAHDRVRARAAARDARVESLVERIGRAARAHGGLHMQLGGRGTLALHDEGVDSEQSLEQIRALLEEVMKGQGKHHLSGACVGHRDEFDICVERFGRGESECKGLAVTWLARKTRQRPVQRACLSPNKSESI